MKIVGGDGCWHSATEARGKDAGEGAMGNFILRRPNASSMLQDGNDEGCGVMSQQDVVANECRAERGRMQQLRDEGWIEQHDVG